MAVSVGKAGKKSGPAGKGGEIIFIENGIQNATPHIQCE